MESPGLVDLLKEHWHLALHLRQMKIRFDAARCVGAMECVEVCPVDCWSLEHETGKVVFLSEEACIACGACVLQCPEEAIGLE